jgi:hypothetical protein
MRKLLFEEAGQRVDPSVSELSISRRSHDSAGLKSIDILSAGV